MGVVLAGLAGIVAGALMVLHLADTQTRDLHDLVDVQSAEIARLRRAAVRPRGMRGAQEPA